MQQPFLRFIQAARRAGIRISVAESLDAVNTLALIGYGDRTLLKDSLSMVMAKTLEEKQQFDAFFDLYFSRASFSTPSQPGADGDAADPSQEAAGPQDGQDATNGGNDAQQPGGQPGGGAQPQSGLAQLLLSRDAAALAAAMETAANEVGIENIHFFTQTGIYGRRILEQMGLDALEADIDRLGKAGAAEVAAALLQGRQYLERQVRGFVEQALETYAKGESERLRDAYLQDAVLTNLDRRDVERMRKLVRALAKRLATKHNRVRRRNRRGHLDVRRMLRRSMAYDGVMFQTHWKQRKIDRPKVVAICDVSGSVSAVAEFLLLFLYGLSEALHDIRSYVFCNAMADVSEIFERHPFEEALAIILREFAFGSSNYGTALDDFRREGLDAIDSKTTVLILGDARGNYTNPRSEVLKSISERAKRVVWLNPEFKSSWGTGDSDMPHYRPYCQVATVCNSVKHLEQVVTDLLKP